MTPAPPREEGPHDAASTPSSASPSGSAVRKSPYDAEPGWKRLAVAFSVVTVSFSEIFYSIIVSNSGEFPWRFSFHAWVVFWFCLVPLGVVCAVDAWLRRRPGLALWRTCLYTTTALSLMLQAALYVAGILDLPVNEKLGPAATIALGSIAALAFAAVSHRFQRAVSVFFVYLSILGVALTGRYAIHACTLDGPPATGGSAPRPSDHPSVVLVVFDELSLDILIEGGEFDAQAFPNFARLSAESVWCADATSNYGETIRSFPTLLTGRLHPTADDPSIFRLLGGTHRITVVDCVIPVENWIWTRDGRSVEMLGRTHAMLWNPIELTAYVGTLALDRVLWRWGRDRFTQLPQIHRYMYGSWEDLERRALAWADPTKASGHMLYWHSPFPHEPYVYDEMGVRRTNSVPSVREAAGRTTELMEGYRRQARYADGQLGKLMARLEDAGIYDRVVLVVTSDHGLRSFLLDELEPAYPGSIGRLAPTVPLLIRAPGIPSQKVEVDVQHIDLAPTLMDVVGIDGSNIRFDGISILDPAPRVREKSFTAGGRTFTFEEATGRWLSR